MTSNPSSNRMNCVKFTVVVAASIAAKQYLEDQKHLPGLKMVSAFAIVRFAAL